MKIRITFDVTRVDRLALAKQLGSEIATREDMETWIVATIEGELDLMHGELSTDEEDQ